MRARKEELLLLEVNKAICNKIKEMPTVEQRPHGKWEWKSPTPITIMTPHCSNCGHMNDFLLETNFCPNCGADMRKEGEAE